MACVESMQNIEWNSLKTEQDQAAENATLVMSYTSGDYMHANIRFRTKSVSWIKNQQVETCRFFWPTR